jgi:hypothetical protein
VESHAPGELNTKMPKATNALNGDQIPASQASIAKGIVGRNARAQQRGGLRGTELIGNGSEAARFSDHHFRISTVHGYLRYHWVLTIHAVSTSARLAGAVLSGDQADANALTDLPSRHAAAQGVDAANDFMTGNAR